MLNTKLKLSFLTASMVLALAACDGDDGEQGPQGPVGEQGPAGQDGADGQDGASGEDGANAQANGKLTRLATVPAGAEVTGAFLTRQGDLFFNVQQ